MTQSNSRKPKIRLKLFAFMAGFTGVVLLLLWLLQVVFLGTIHRSVRVSETKDIAKKLASYTEAPITLESKAEKLARSKSVCIVAYRFDRIRAKEMFSCDITENCVIHSMENGELISMHRKAMENGGSLLCYYSYNSERSEYELTNEVSDGQSIVYSFIVKDARGDDMLFIINSEVAPVASTVRTLNYLLVIISITMIILSVILTLILSSSITKPITRINSSAKELAKGNYSVNFEGGSYREAEELSETLTYASSELSRVEKLRSELIANTTHDLRTPLTMITGYAELMRDLEGENTPENAAIIADEAKRMTSLVNDMLEISKLENGVAKANFEQFNITESVAAEIEKYQEFCRKDGYTLRFEANESVVVKTDRTKITRALLNLVNNALTYTGNDRTVIVRQERYFNGERDVLRYSVIDSGEGIPEDKLPLIWDRYYKVDSPHKRSAQGSGLGLSIVNKLMTLIGGRCGVLSSNGNGSIFWIEIDI
ncbi:MAG: HAMP domain-containing histidine kinase [Clostridia bacterium]|nr:HAMP domain-containing histidine kinase [Clostridia bacterium]